MARYVEIIEILAGENFPVAVEKGPPKVGGQRGERLQIILIGGVDGIVMHARGDEIVIGGIVTLRIFHSCGRLLINPQRLHPGVADVAGIRGAGHVWKCFGDRAAIAAGEKLPLAQGEESELVDADEKKFRTLILVDVIFGGAVAEAGGRAVEPGDDVLRVVEARVEFARDFFAEIKQQRLLELGKGAAEQERVGAHVVVGLHHRFHEQRHRFAGTGRAAEESVFRGRFVEVALLGEGRVGEEAFRGVGVFRIGVGVGISDEIVARGVGVAWCLRVDVARCVDVSGGVRSSSGVIA